MDHNISTRESAWKDILEATIQCVLDNSPDADVLAKYLGRDVQNAYKVSWYDSLSFN